MITKKGKEKIDNVELKNTYTIKYWCRNCREDFYETFEFGQIAHQGACPYCGVSQEDMEFNKL